MKYNVATSNKTKQQKHEWISETLASDGMFILCAMGK